MKGKGIDSSLDFDGDLNLIGLPWKSRKQGRESESIGIPIFESQIFPRRASIGRPMTSISVWGM